MLIKYLSSNRWINAICEIADEIEEPYAVAECLLSLGMQSASKKVNLPVADFASAVEKLSSKALSEFMTDVARVCKEEWLIMPEGLKQKLRKS